MLKRIPALRKTGAEPFRDGDGILDFTVLDFWGWSSSDMVSNAVRGRAAEFLIAQALGIAHGVRSDWDSHDLTTPSGLRIEVKSAAYLQAWAQRAESAISFDIRPTLAWDADSNVFAPENQRRRQADLYIFALLAHRLKDTLNPLDVSQWQFFLLATKTLDERMKIQKRLSLSALKTLSPLPCAFRQLRECIGTFEPRAGQ